MATILLATRNKAKIAELSAGIKSLCPGVTTVSLTDLNITKNIDEIGQTFEENASLKARYYSEFAKMPTIADDGGIMIDFLNGEPGVKTRRWLGYEMTDQELINHTLDTLANVPFEKRVAKFRTAICYYNPSSKSEYTESADVSGIISETVYEAPSDDYPFRKIFIVDGLNKFYAEMTREEHAKINHRLKALKRLMKNVSPELI